MPWLRVGDSVTTNPLFTAPLDYVDDDPDIKLTLFGFVVACGTVSAAHLTDYVVLRSTAIQVASSHERADYLLELATRTGVMERVEVDGRIGYRIIADAEFIHMRERDEVEWERQRKNDRSNPALMVPVRLRDGDACRWCGVVVNWSDHRGGRGATLDHLEPGSAATVETAVVSCRSCNSARKDDPDLSRLLSAPPRPFFSESTVRWLERSTWRKQQGLVVPAVSSPSECASVANIGSTG